MRFKSDIQYLIHAVQQKLDAGKAEHIVTLDVRRLSSIADAMIIATGTSTRHVMALAHHLSDDLKQKKIPVYNDVHQGDGHWVVLDLGTVLVHIFTDEMRIQYDLESLWQKPKKERIRKAPQKSA